MKLPTIRLRTLLIVVAILGLILSMAARSERFRRKAMFHQSQSYLGAQKTTATLPGGVVKVLYVPTMDGWRHFQMRHQMEKAAWRPWWPFDPEPLPRDLPPPDAFGFVE